MLGKAAHIADTFTDAARAEQHSRQHQLLDGVGVGTGRVEYRHATCRAGLYRNVVDASASARNCQRGSRNIRLGKLMAAQQNGIRRRNRAGELVAVTWKTIQTNDGNLVERKNAEHVF